MRHRPLAHHGRELGTECEKRWLKLQAAGPSLSTCLLTLDEEAGPLTGEMPALKWERLLTESRALG